MKNPRATGIVIGTALSLISLVLYKYYYTKHAKRYVPIWASEHPYYQ